MKFVQDILLLIIICSYFMWFNYDENKIKTMEIHIDILAHVVQNLQYQLDIMNKK